MGRSDYQGNFKSVKIFIKAGLIHSFRYLRLSDRNEQRNSALCFLLANVYTFFQARHPQLLYESKVYRILQGGVGIPHIRWSAISFYFADAQLCSLIRLHFALIVLDLQKLIIGCNIFNFLSICIELFQVRYRTRVQCARYGSSRSIARGFVQLLLEALHDEGQ